MMKLSELIAAARCRRPRFFAIAIALGAAAALAASAEAGTGPATAAAITNLASYRALSAAASLRIFHTVDGTSVYPRPVSCAAGATRWTRSSRSAAGTATRSSC